MGEAAAVVAFRDDLVLVVCDPDTRRMCLPGGGIEPGESPEQAARWELYEETGLRAGILVPLGVVHSTSVPCHMFWAASYTGELKASPEGYPLWVLPSELLANPRGPGYRESSLQALSAAWRAQGRHEAKHAEAP